MPVIHDVHVGGGDVAMDDEIVCGCGHVSVCDNETVYLKCVSCESVLVDRPIDCIEM